MGVSIRLLGKPGILNERGEAQAVRGLQSWALLARILLSERPVRRRELASELFPQAVDPLGSLRWCLASLRRALGSAEALRGDPVESNLPEGTEVDVRQLREGHIDTGALGDLLQGMEPQCGPEFATWLLIERQRIAALIDAHIRQETIQAVSVGDYDRAIRLAERGVRRLPLDEGAHVLLVKSLTLAGRHEAAMDHVEATETAFLDELGEKPSAALRSAARRTIAAPPGGVSPDAVVRSLLESGRAALSAGAVDAGLDCLRRAAADAEKGSDSRLRAGTLLELGTALVHSVRGYDDEGSILLRQAIDRARESSDPRTMAAGLRELGYVDALAGRRPAAAAHLSRALELADGDEDSLAGIHSVIGFNLVDWNKVSEGLEHYALSLEHARSVENSRREAWTLGLGGWGHLRAGRPEVAKAWLSDCLAIVDDLRWVAFRPWPLAVLAEARLGLESDPGALRPELEETFALSCQLADPCWEGAAARTLALAHAAGGDTASAIDLIIEARERCTRETDTYVAMHAAILASHAEIARGAERPAESDLIARELLSLAARAHMDGYLKQALNFIGEA
ncbi:MAG TPA: BTAD domain-containing putative transcriptional regulator [Gammaproteobacteria bacterium]|nr:BTAD domain-containing putative transcriptional regulator [Gammaproteobacteria bacterium]